MTARPTIAFRDDIARESGSLASGGMRLFLVPGVQHCAGGPGPDVLGQLGAPPSGAKPERRVPYETAIAFFDSLTDTQRATTYFADTHLPVRDLTLTGRS